LKKGKGEIPIKCRGTREVPLFELKEFQGNLKELSETKFEKLKASIERNGFRFPVFTWGDYILDGHQRIFVLNRMVEEGWRIGKIPVVEIEAKDKREAQRLLLLISSRYGEIREDGLRDFLKESRIDFDELKKEIALPEIDVMALLKGEGKEKRDYGDLVGGFAEGIGREVQYVSVTLNFPREYEKRIKQYLNRVGKRGLEKKVLGLMGVKDDSMRITDHVV
jgi:hypothetical protein